MHTAADKVLDHFNNPRNVGILNKNDQTVGTGIVGSPFSSKFIKLQIKIDPTTNFIEDSKFKAYGCYSTIAACSFATEWLIGKHLQDALKIAYSKISEELSLPEIKIFCSIMVEDVVKAAVQDYQLRNP